MSIKGLLYFDLGCWEVDQRASLHWSRTTEMSIKGLLYFDLNCWNVDQRASLLWSKLLPAKSQNLGIDFKWWVLCGPTIVVMCDFQLFLLDLNFFIFSKKTLMDFCSSLKKILSLDFETWNLKFETFRIWNLKFEVENLGFENWNLGIWDLKLEILKIWNWKF